ncbi:MAG: M2 family metallopeptidase, partial [Pseudomonadota bacterium]
MRISRVFCAAAATAGLLGCSPQAGTPAPPAESATDFVTRLNTDMARYVTEVMTADWVQDTFVTADTQLLNARANERFLEYFSKTASEARRYDGMKLDTDTARALELLKQGVSAPAPNDPVRRGELAAVASRMDATYSTAKSCRTQSGKEVCRTYEDLATFVAGNRDFDELTQAWEDWHATARVQRDDYARFVELANEGARDLGYADVGAMWRSGYDMPPEDFAKEVDRLWDQIKPLYVQMHCYARAQLAHKYGADKVPAGQPIPAQLFGNLWSQDWTYILPDILLPYPGVAAPSIDGALKAQGYDAVKMTRSAEAFYVSMGFPALPPSFWDKSMLTRPRDREVDCYASASNMDFKGDVRVKMCIEPTGELLEDIYHELGHVYYYLAVKDQPPMFQGGANDGFHEAIGDTIVLSMTPGYLAKAKLAATTKPTPETVINEQMRLAADRVAFIPFGAVVDQWRWKVFAGEIKPADYNKTWWDLRRKYQGIVPPGARTEADFDPAAKYHIPGNTPYARYLLAIVLQFQFHRALCDASGFKGPLHECSVFGSKEAGAKFREMLA